MAVLFLFGNTFLNQSNVPGTENQNNYLLGYIMSDITTPVVAEEVAHHRTSRHIWVISCGGAIIMATKIVVSCNQICI